MLLKQNNNKNKTTTTATKQQQQQQKQQQQQQKQQTTTTTTTAKTTKWEIKCWDRMPLIIPSRNTLFGMLFLHIYSHPPTPPSHEEVHMSWAQDYPK